MKKKDLLITLIFTLFSFTVKAQITGPTTIHFNDQETYSIPNLGQCSQCYDWDETGDITIVSSDMNNSVTIQAGNSAGNGVLTVTYFNETGCHEITLPITVECEGPGCDIIELPGGCCIPTLDSYFICRGWLGGHGAVYIDFTGNDCDRRSVSSIDWVVNGAVFSSGPLKGQSSGTTFGAGSPGNIQSDCNRIRVTATVHYNNGCPDVTLTENIDIGSGPRKTIIYPNPTKSEINIDLFELKKMNEVEIKLFDLNTGKEVYSKKVLKSELNETITINRLDNYKSLKIVILNDGKIIKKSTILIE
jgi:hypothetical protein